jgi:hypothetical protein
VHGLTSNLQRALMRTGAMDRHVQAPQAERMQLNYKIELIRDTRDIAALGVAAYQAANGRAPSNASTLLHPEVPRFIDGKYTLNGKPCCYDRADSELRKVETLRLPYDFACVCGTQWRISTTVERRQ